MKKLCTILFKPLFKPATFSDLNVNIQLDSIRTFINNCIFILNELPLIPYGTQLTINFN